MSWLAEWLFLIVLLGQATGLFLMAMLTGSRSLYLAPVLGWPLFYLGAERGWWTVLYLESEFPTIAAGLLALAGVIGVLFGLSVHRGREQASS